MNARAELRLARWGAVLALAACSNAEPHAWVEFREGAPVTGFGISDGSLTVSDAGPEPHEAGVYGADAAVVFDASGSGELSTELVVEYLTHPQGGRFAPRNIGATWVERSDGGWVKTLEVWATIRARYLERFNLACGGNRVDAVSRATLKVHELHRVTWDLRGAQGTRVTPGDYRVVVEVTDGNRAGATVELPFSVQPNGRGAHAFGSQPYFTDLSVLLR